jgi:hypothetical protein
MSTRNWSFAAPPDMRPLHPMVTHLPPRCTENSYPAIRPTARIAFNRAFGHIRNYEIDHSGIHRMRIDGSRICTVYLPRRAPPWTSTPSGRRTASRSFRPPQRHRQAGRRAGRLRDQSPRHRASARHAVPDQGLATAPTGRPTARRSSSAAPRPRTSCAATSGRSTPTAPLCGGPARRPADKGLLGVILPRRHGDHPPVGRGRRSDDVAGGANGRPCDVLGLAHLGTDAHLGAQPRRLRERTLRKFRDSSPPTGGRPPPASAYRCAGGRVGGQARHACCGRAPAVATARAARCSSSRRLSHISAAAQTGPFPGD